MDSDIVLDSICLVARERPKRSQQRRSLHNRRRFWEVQRKGRKSSSRPGSSSCINGWPHSQHKQESHDLINKREDTVGGQRDESGSGRSLGKDGGKYAKNTLYEILKEFIKIFLRSLKMLLSPASIGVTTRNVLRSPLCSKCGFGESYFYHTVWGAVAATQ